ADAEEAAARGRAQAAPDRDTSHSGIGYDAHVSLASLPRLDRWAREPTGALPAAPLHWLRPEPRPRRPRAGLVPARTPGTLWPILAEAHHPPVLLGEIVKLLGPELRVERYGLFALGVAVGGRALDEHGGLALGLLPESLRLGREQKHRHELGLVWVADALQD